MCRCTSSSRRSTRRARSQVRWCTRHRRASEESSTGLSSRCRFLALAAPMAEREEQRASRSCSPLRFRSLRLRLWRCHRRWSTRRLPCRPSGACTSHPPPARTTSPSGCRHMHSRARSGRSLGSACCRGRRGSPTRSRSLRRRERRSKSRRRHLRPNLRRGIRKKGNLP